MAKPDDDAITTTAQPHYAPRRRFDARRLLIATIGAATVNYVAGCGNDTLFTSVANLMAPPILPPSAGVGGASGATASDGGSAAGAADGGAKDDDAGVRR